MVVESEGILFMGGVITVGYYPPLCIGKNCTPWTYAYFEIYLVEVGRPVPKACTKALYNRQRPVVSGVVLAYSSVIFVSEAFDIFRKILLNANAK